MKTRIALTLMFLWLAGCQPESEVDKCVEAQIKAEQFTVCKGLKGDDEIECKKVIAIGAEASGRLLCLRAKASN
jgi:hypothetical protein